MKHLLFLFTAVLLFFMVIGNSTASALTSLNTNSFIPKQIGGQKVYYYVNTGYTFDKYILQNVNDLKGKITLSFNSYNFGNNYSATLCNHVNYYKSGASYFPNYQKINEPSNFITTLPVNAEFRPYFKTPNINSCINTLVFSTYWRQKVTAKNRIFHVELRSSNKLISGIYKKFTLIVTEGSKPLPYHNVYINIQDDLKDPYALGGGMPAVYVSYHKILRTNKQGILTFDYNASKANISPVILNATVADELGYYWGKPSTHHLYVSFILRQGIIYTIIVIVLIFIVSFWLLIKKIKLKKEVN